MLILRESRASHSYQAPYIVTLRSDSDFIQIHLLSEADLQVCPRDSPSSSIHYIYKNQRIMAATA